MTPPHPACEQNRVRSLVITAGRERWLSAVRCDSGRDPSALSDADQTRSGVGGRGLQFGREPLLPSARADQGAVAIPTRPPPQLPYLVVASRDSPSRVPVLVTYKRVESAPRQPPSPTYSRPFVRVETSPNTVRLLSVEGIIEALTRNWASTTHFLRHLRMRACGICKEDICFRVPTRGVELPIPVFISRRG